MNQTELGYRIKQCRKLQKLTQENLAELVDVSPHYIYEIERGLKSMSLATLADISTVLNVSTDYLLFGTPCDAPSLPEYSKPVDRLTQLLQPLSPQKRDIIADILSAMLPHLK